MKKQFNLVSTIAAFQYRRLSSVLIFSTLLFYTISASAQVADDKDAAFRKVLTERSGKIVSSLDITKPRKKEKLTQIIANQYYNLNKVHDNVSDASDKRNQLIRLHQEFIAKLQKKLSAKQVEKVKNGMTYNVLNVTYTAYQDMILTLTEVQKDKIYKWLVEARENAMMEGSSDDKHKVFGKYKGKINNYLSSEGYDMKAEEKAWQQRLREKREKEAAAKKMQTA